MSSCWLAVMMTAVLACDTSVAQIEQDQTERETVTREAQRYVRLLNPSGMFQVECAEHGEYTHGTSARAYGCVARSEHVTYAYECSAWNADNRGCRGGRTL